MKTEQNNQLKQPQTRIQSIRKQTARSLKCKTGDNESPVIRFSPTAWAKLLYFRDKSDNEIGGFAITLASDLLFVQDFVTVKQEVTGISVKFDDAAVADFFDAQVDLGRKPEQFARIWLHSHPGNSPEPSIIDEETFGRVFGNCQWALMFVVAQNSRTYARLSFNIGPGCQVLIPVEVDYSRDFGPSDHLLWDAEYEANVRVGAWLTDLGGEGKGTGLIGNDFGKYSLPSDFITELERMEPAERKFVLDELADRPDLWDEDEEVMFI